MTQLLSAALCTSSTISPHIDSFKVMTIERSESKIVIVGGEKMRSEFQPDERQWHWQTNISVSSMRMQSSDVHCTKANFP